MALSCKIKTAELPDAQAQTLEEDEKIIVCASCNCFVTDPSKQILVNESFYHVFANPHGHVFEIGCFSQAVGCRACSMPSEAFSWFSGFSWQVGACSHCTSHLGWLFISDRKIFYGLILDRLIFP